ncbi:MAG: gfo/Idh/MocA family oxidoreductase [Acidobacteria bacterium]|nr:gfo/Idh/MocA family oxidoreductase [Acidobacteriota bacterium]
MPHNLAIIGTGDIVRKAYLPILTRREDCRVGLICGRRIRPAEELAGLFAITRATIDLADVLAQEDIDAVLVCTPTDLHYPMAMASLGQGKHALVEKPLCTSLNDTLSLTAAAKKLPSLLYPAFNNWFREENQAICQRVTQGDLGEVEWIDLEWFRTPRYAEKLWLYDRARSGGGVLMDLGTHLIHFALSLIPDRRCFSLTAHTPAASGTEDTCAVTLEIDNRILVTIRVGWKMALPFPSQVRLTVYGSKGAASNQDYHGPRTDGYSRMIGDFLDCLNDERQPALAVATDTMVLVDAIYRALSTPAAVDGTFSRHQEQTVS